MKVTRTCSIGDCDRAHVARGLCGMHYQAQRVANPIAPRCTIEGCDRASHCRGWCRSHYQRWFQVGDVRADVPLVLEIPVGMSRCSKCQELKPKSEFTSARDRPSGTQAYCRACTSVLRATKYKTAINDQQKRWRLANPEVVARYDRGWRSRYPDRARAKSLRWAEQNPERYRLAQRSGDHNRRARNNAASGFCTTAQLAARWEYFGGKCWMCPAPADVTDHVKPLARGGSNWPSNLRPACRACNASKGAKWPFKISVRAA